MHSGACTNRNVNSFIFFGLSGTGKTTLSTDVDTNLIGDDEHGLSITGIFNFENGCYAKTYKLSEDSEPEIYKASTQVSSFLENVKLEKLNGKLDFMNSEITENGRASYPLTFIKSRVLTGAGPIPKDIFFLSADAFGVLPAISKLNLAQVRKFFTLGYTAKLAGTEIGVLHPKATFSSCFGAPFMLQYPKVYADLLCDFVEKNNIRVWLLNTGWFGGPYGEGQRFPLKVTRQIIRSIQSGNTDSIRFASEQNMFELKIPNAITGVESQYLDPAQTWKDPQKYMLEAKKLNDLFNAHASEL
jgi:phosphoenolpyruvate carboxykinase (ATP)